MTREQGPKFSQKHGPDEQADPTLKQYIENKTKNGEITCAAAFQIADELSVSPAEIGKGIDLLDVRLIKCQLGLFGYGPGKKAVKPKSPEHPELEAAIRMALAGKKLACHDAWDIASQFDLPKMAVSAACEALNIKIKPCQLGAF
jgi:hypothetical protein